MYSLLFLGITSALLALLLTPLVRNMAWHFGIVDQPDQKRKIHRAPIPRMGGMALLMAIVGSYGLLLAVRLSAGAIVWEGLPLVLRLLPALAVIFSIGLVDDIISIRPWQKFAAEVVAATLAWSGGIHVSGISGHSFSSVVSFGITILWIVLCTNAINLIDGVDGLAAGVSLFAAATMFISALLNHNISLALALAPVLGALLGFLRYNFRPASIFLGDCGSLTLGFLLGCYGAVWSEKSTTLLGLAGPLLVLAVPLIDVGLAIARRFVRNQPIFGADGAHIHHKLRSRGMTDRHVVLVLYGISALTAGASLLLSIMYEQYRGFFLVLVCLSVWLGIQHLGYYEFGIAGNVVFGGAIRSVLSAQIALHAFEDEICKDMTPKQCWELLCSTCPKFGFSGCVLYLDGEMLRWGTEKGWQARIDFANHGYVSLWRKSGATGSGAVAVLFVDSVSRAFNQKLSQLEAILQ